jgi:hypothetical protein
VTFLANLRAWRAKRKQHDQEDYAERRGFTSAEELDELRKSNRADVGRAEAFGYSSRDSERPRY